MRNGSSKRDTLTPKQVRVAIYTRKSTEENLDLEFNSLQAQREAVEAFILSRREKNWIPLSDRFDDGGFSGATTNRPAFQQLLQHIQEGRVDLVAVYRYDRLSRSLFDFLQVLRFFEKHHVGFIAVSQNFDTTTSIGRLSLNMVMSFAEFERECISERTKAKMGATRRRGQWTGGRPPLGYDLEEKRLTVNEEEAGRVRLIFQLYLEKGTLLSVSSELNRRGWTTKAYTTKSGKHYDGKRFAAASVHRILTSPIYLGQVEYEGERYEGEHEAIVDEETWQAAQDLLEQNRGRCAPKHRTKWNALLRGILKCGVCGTPMVHHYTSKKNRKFHAYICHRIITNGASGCRGSRVPMQQLEGFVVQKIAAIGKDPALVADTVATVRKQVEKREPELKTEIQQLRIDIASFKRRKKDLASRLTQDGEDTKSLLSEIEQADTSLKEAEKGLEAAKASLEGLQGGIIDERTIQAAIGSFVPIWEHLFPAERERIIHLLIEEITYNAGTGEVGITFRPNGIQALSLESEEEAA